MPNSEENAENRIPYRPDIPEQLYFSMFPVDSTPKFRRFLLYVVYTTIKENSGITTNKIQWKLDNDYALKVADIEIAINALSNPRIFNAVSKFHLKQKAGEEKQVIHLRLRRNRQELIQSWMDRVLEDFPEYAEMNSGK